MWQPVWKEVEGFKNWLVLDPLDFNHVRCHICNIQLGCTTTTLKNHTKSADHENECRKRGIPVFYDFEIPQKSKAAREMAIAELKYAAIIASNGISFKKSKKLAKQLGNVDKTSIFNRLKMAATKTRDLVVKAISGGAKQELANNLKSNYFSICLDESTDVSKDKVLVIMVRFVDLTTNEISTRMWDLVPVLLPGVDADSGAQRIFECVVDSFEKYEVPIENILIGSCTDGAMTMIGDVSGLKQRLQALIPHLLWIICPAHKTHLCAKHSTKFLPEEIIELLTKFYSMLNSSNRQRNFRNIQEKLQLPLHKIPKWIQLRWLSMLQCVQIGIEQWPALLEFSQNLKDSKGRPDGLGQEIYELMKEPDTICYFYLLEHVLTPLTTLNKFFQRNDPVNPLAKEMIEKTFKTLLSSIMIREYVTDIAPEELNLYDSSKYLMYADFELGEKLRSEINHRGMEMETFFGNAFIFILAACEEMKARFDFNDNLLNAFRCLQPTYAIDEAFHELKEELFDDYLRNFLVLIESDEMNNRLKIQWKNLPGKKNEILKEVSTRFFPGEEFQKDFSLTKIVQFWFALFYLEDKVGNRSFAELAGLVLISLTVPHANADTERLFSVMNYMKNKHKNSLHVETVEAILRTRELCLLFDESEGGFQPSDFMIDLCMSKRFYKQKKPSLPKIKNTVITLVWSALQKVFKKNA